MLCPIDQSQLVMTERQGVEIDYCPKCRGIWLDRGELDKILDRAATEAPGQPAPAAPLPQHAPPQGYDRPRAAEYRRDYDDDRHKHGHYPHKKRKSFLSDILDFD